jgi:hypothetical protein
VERGPGEQVARLEVALRGRREEQLAVGELEDGLEAPEERLVVGCGRRDPARPTTSNPSLVFGEATPTLTRTSRWLR